MGRQAGYEGRFFSYPACLLGLIVCRLLLFAFQYVVHHLQYLDSVCDIHISHGGNQVEILAHEEIYAPVHMFFIPEILKALQDQTLSKPL